MKLHIAGNKEVVQQFTRLLGLPKDTTYPIEIDKDIYVVAKAKFEEWYKSYLSTTKRKSGFLDIETWN